MLFCCYYTPEKPRNQALSHHNTAFHQLLKPVSRHEFESLAKNHHSGQKLRSATRWDQFIGMIMAQVAGTQSLRDIQSNLEAQRLKLYHLGAKPIARSTLARLNENSLLICSEVCSESCWPVAKIRPANTSSASKTLCIRSMPAPWICL